MTEEVPNLEGRDKQLQLVSDELDREVAAHGQRANSMEQRATILIGAAGIIGALQSDGPLWAINLNLVLSFLAAVAGVIVVFPRRGDALNIRPIRDHALEMEPSAAKYKLIDTKIEILEADERWLGIRGWITRAGFVFLAMSIAVALLGSASEHFEQHPAPSPSSTESSAGHAE